MIFQIYSPAKVNLMLHVTHKRNDGYHHIQSVFGFYNVFDVLTLKKSNVFKFGYTSNHPLDENFKNNNGIIKAHYWMMQKFPLIPLFNVHLEKNLPLSSGLGGGSSNMAAYVYALCQSMDLNQQTMTSLIPLLGELGADVPVCFQYHVFQHPLFFVDGTGKEGGKIIDPIPSCAKNPLYLIHPYIPISSKTIFQNFNEFSQPINVFDFEQIILTGKNSLTQTIIRLYPKVAQLLETLCLNNTISRVSGSGSTCFTFGQDALFDDMWVKKAILMQPKERVVY